MKKIITLLAIVTFCLSAKAQKVELFTNFDFGVLSHQSLKEFHNDLVEEIPFNNIKTTDNFDFNYGFTVGLKFNKINTSFFYSSKVSGAKSSYVDYSGHIKLTNELQGATFGVIYGIDLQKLGKGDLSLGFKGLITNSKLTLKSENKILTIEDNSNFIFKSLDFGTGLTLVYEYPLRFMTLRTLFGFDYYLGGKLKFEEIDDAHLLNKNGDNVTTGWSGLNAGIGIEIPLIK